MVSTQNEPGCVVCHTTSRIVTVTAATAGAAGWIVT